MDFSKKLIWPQWQIAWPYQDAVSIMWLVGAVFMCMCTCRQGRERVCVFLYPLSGMGWLMFVCCCSGCYSQFTWQWWGLWFGLRVDTLILPLREKLLGERGSEELSEGVREQERKEERGRRGTNKRMKIKGRNKENMSVFSHKMSTAATSTPKYFDSSSCTLGHDFLFSFGYIMFPLSSSHWWAGETWCSFVVCYDYQGLSTHWDFSLV